MATVAQLNVEIGARIKGLQDGIRQSERDMKRFSANMSSMANGLMTSISLPLAGIGISAIKFAGDMEAMRKGMIATFAGSGRSAEAATAEMEKLRKAAEAPGLDFEQAVKGSLRLQGVGLSAEKSRNIIVQLANAISAAGGTAENLNGVTIQMAQMIAKGKILNSDLNVMKENMPNLAKIMQDTFGTSQADDLREMGISGKEFVERITAAMEKLPRVEGGISNSVVNAGTAIKMFLADVGETLNKTFNISDKLDNFSKWLDDLGKRFRSMDEGTQKAILGVGVFALALGPAIKAGSMLIQTSAFVVNGLAAMQANFLKAGSAIGAVTTWWNGLNTAMKLSIIGAAIGVVLALAVAFKSLETDMSAAAVAQRDVLDVSKKAQESVVEEKTKVDLLIATINSNTSSLDAKKKALKDLQAISPKYFGDLKLEHDRVTGLTAANNAYAQSLIRAAMVKAAQDKINENAKADINLASTSGPDHWQKLQNVLSEVGKNVLRMTTGGLFTLMGSDMRYAAENAKTLGENIANGEMRIRASNKEAFALIQANTDAAGGMIDLTGATTGNTKATETSTEAKKGAAKAARDIAKAAREEHERLVQIAQDANGVALAYSMMNRAYNERAPIAPIAPTTSSFQPGVQSTTKDDPTANIKSITEGFQPANAALEQFKTLSEGAQAAMTNLGVTSFDVARGIGGAMEAVGPAFQGIFQSLMGIEGAYRNVGVAALMAAAQVVKAALMESMAIAIKKSLAKSGHPLIGIALAGVAVAGVEALFAGLTQKLSKAPKFATGTKFAPGGMAIVGELGGGGELVNLPRGSQVTPANQTNSMLRGMMSGGQPIILTPSLEVSPQSMRVMLQHETKKQDRMSGK